MVQIKSQKTIDYFKKISQKSKIHKRFAIMMIMLIITCNSIQSYFINNCKRFACVCITGLLFTLSCSFALPSTIGTGANDAFYLPGKSDSIVDQVIEEQLNEMDEELIEVDREFNEMNQSTQIHRDSQVYSLEDILEGTGMEEYESLLSEAESEEYDSIDPDSWNMILVNKQNPVPQGYEVELATIKDGMKCDARILPFLFAMFQAAKDEAGIELIVCSPYRDYERQTYLFDNKINSFLSQGFSYMDSYKLASSVVTVPGASEHQIGLAIDIISSTYWQLEVGFADTKAGAWLADNSYRFGFILRYPLGKEHITGVQFEPWHFRYVGITAATMMAEQDLTLEEFVEDL